MKQVIALAIALSVAATGVVFAQPTAPAKEPTKAEKAVVGGAHLMNKKQNMVTHKKAAVGHRYNKNHPDSKTN